jgi:hypothetical protein
VELVGLMAEIDRLEAAELNGDPRVLGVEALELRRAAQRLLAQSSRRLVPFDRAEGYLDADQTSTKAWLRAQTTMSHGEAAGQEAVARLREKLPTLFAAWDAGATTFDHVRQVEIQLRKLPDELWAEVDAPVTAKARILTVKDFRTWLEKLAESLDGDPKPRDETQHESRRLSLSLGFNRMTDVTGRLTPEVAEKFHAALSAASRPDTAGEVRYKNQRTADALEHVLDTVLDTGRLPVEGGEKPHLTLAVDLDRLSEQTQRDEQDPRPGHWWTLTDQQQADRLTRSLADADTTLDPASGRPRYSWTGPTSTSAARRLACDGILLPIFTRGQTPIDVGRSYRTISNPMRAFIVARDQHCQWPACTIPARWCVCHHVLHWKDSGTTDRWNLLLLCPHHHKAAHNGQWTIVLHAPGTITVHRRQHPHDPYYDIRIKAPPPPSEPRSVPQQ